MQNVSHREPRTESLMDTGEAIMPLPRPSARQQALRAEVERDTTFKILLVCSSVVAAAVASLCYALLLQ